MSSWADVLRQMRNRIQRMRGALRTALEERLPTHDFSHLTNQRGMFSFTGLAPNEACTLRCDHGVFLGGAAPLPRRAHDQASQSGRRRDRSSPCAPAMILTAPLNLEWARICIFLNITPRSGSDSPAQGSAPSLSPESLGTGRTPYNWQRETSVQTKSFTDRV